MRTLTYCEAINETLHQEMELDSSIFLMGIGVPDHKSIFGSVAGITQKFGPERCLDTPISEDTMTGVALGAAINGMRPIHIHIRVDFLILAMNQIANMLSSFSYGNDGKLSAPVVIRAVIGRGWGQGFQHSKSLHSTFAHIPGLKVVLPTTPYDVKGLMSEAIRDNNPVLVIEHRWLYWQEGYVPEAPYQIPLGKANVLREGTDLTIIGTSWMNVEALVAADFLQNKYNLSIEIVDVRSIAPLDEETLIQSVKKTKHCIVVDHDWSYCGLNGEIAAVIYEHCFAELSKPIDRIGLAHTPCPTVRNLEDEFYPNAADIIHSAEKMFDYDLSELPPDLLYTHEKKFKGPF